jgi:hypothetical protein
MKTEIDTRSQLEYLASSLSRSTESRARVLAGTIRWHIANTKSAGLMALKSRLWADFGFARNFRF